MVIYWIDLSRQESPALVRCKQHYIMKTLQNIQKIYIYIIFDKYMCVFIITFKCEKNTLFKHNITRYLSIFQAVISNLTLRINLDDIVTIYKKLNNFEENSNVSEVANGFLKMTSTKRRVI